MTQWRAVVGFEELYAVSDDGRVKRIGPDRMGRCRNTILKPSDRNGYSGVTLCAEGVTKTLSVHRMMWEAFYSPIPVGMQINHINGGKKDNRLDNLELVTPGGNMWHMRHILKRRQVVPPPRRGSENKNSKITEADAYFIIASFNQGSTAKSLAQQFNLNKTTIYRILRGQAWAHLAPVTD